MSEETLKVPDHELLRVIGRGAYGEVWLARTVLGEYRAVKIVHQERLKDERAYKREYAGLERYEPVSRKYSGLVQVLHVGRNDPEGLFYYVMELADHADGPFPDHIDAYVPHTLALDLKRHGHL